MKDIHHSAHRREKSKLGSTQLSSKKHVIINAVKPKQPDSPRSKQQNPNLEDCKKYLDTKKPSEEILLSTSYLLGDIVNIFKVLSAHSRAQV